MVKINYKWIKAFGILPCVVLLMSACSKDVSYSEPGENPLLFMAESSWDVVSKADASSEQPFTGNDFAVYSYYHQNGTSASVPFMVNQKVVRTQDSNSWTYSPSKFWPANEGDALSFYGYAPHVETVDNENLTADFTIDGKMNVVWARNIRTTAGAVVIEKTPGEMFTYAEGKDGIDLIFKHCLQKLSFMFIRHTGFGQKYNLENLTVKGANNSVTLDIKDGTLTVNSGTGDFVLGDGNTSYIVEDRLYAQAVKDVMYITPNTGSLDIEVTILGVKYELDKVTLPDPDEGKSYLINIEFTGVGIKPTVTLTPWNTYEVADGPEIQ